LLATTLAKEMPEVEICHLCHTCILFDKKGIHLTGIDISMQMKNSQDRITFRCSLTGLSRAHKGQVLQDKGGHCHLERTGLKLFNTTENVVGKNVEWNKKDYSGIYRISGVF